MPNLQCMKIALDFGKNYIVIFIAGNDATLYVCGVGKLPPVDFETAPKYNTIFFHVCDMRRLP